MKKIFIAATACLAVSLLYSCQSDRLGDEPDAPSQSTKTFTPKAFLSVRLNMQDSGTRGEDGGTTAGTDFNYDYIVHESDTIYDAAFYFYDEEGNYVTQAKLWTGYDKSKDSATGNVEKSSNVILALDTIIDKPTYVMTVLNKPYGYYDGRDFTPGATIAKMYGKYCYDIYHSKYTYRHPWHEFKDENGTTHLGMIMSTSTYVNGNPYFQGTYIPPEYYQAKVEDAETANPLDIYVERVGAKITVEKDFDRDWDVKNKVMHFDNDATKLVPLYKMDNVTIIGAEDYEVYVGLYGWELTGYQPQGYLFKHIKDTWTNDYLGFNWNDPDNHRSYWEYQYFDGRTTFATHYTTAGMSNLYYMPYHPHKTNGYGCHYIPFNGEGTRYSTDDGYYVPEYIYPNTNTPTVQAKFYPSALTNVLIFGRIITKDKGGYYNDPDLVRYKGHLYTLDAFRKWAWNELKARGYKFYIVDTGYELPWAGLDVYSSPYLNGRVIVQLCDVYQDESIPTFDENGNEISHDVIEKALESLNYKDEDGDGINDIPEEEAVGYKDAAMYYSIPIEHLNNGKTLYNTDGTVYSVPAGKYGVVRNHWYQINLKSLDHIGQGVWDENEEIVPNPKDELFYKMEATIKVMPWTVHKQTLVL